MVAVDDDVDFEQSDENEQGGWEGGNFPPLPPDDFEYTHPAAELIPPPDNFPTQERQIKTDAPYLQQVPEMRGDTKLASSSSTPPAIGMAATGWNTQVEISIQPEREMEPFLAQPIPKNIGLVIPKENSLEKTGEPKTPRIAVITLRSTGNKETDVHRLKRVYGKLVSSPGFDHFVFQVYENERIYLLEFPNETTGLTSELIAKLIEQAGEGNLRIDPYRVQ